MTWSLWVTDKPKNERKKENVKILKEIRLPELLGNVYANQDATVSIGHGTMNWFKIGKEICQSYIFLPCLFNFCAGKIMKNKILDQIQARNKIYVGNMNNLIYPNDRRIIGT